MSKNPLQLANAIIMVIAGAFSLYVGVNADRTNLSEIVDPALAEAAFLFLGILLVGGGVLMGLVAFVKAPPKSD